MYSFTLSLTSALHGDGWSVPRPSARPGTHCIAGWVGPKASLDVQKISPPPGSNPWTVQPVASHYADSVIPTHWLRITYILHIAYIYIYIERERERE